MCSVVVQWPARAFRAYMSSLRLRRSPQHVPICVRITGDYTLAKDVNLRVCGFFSLFPLLSFFLFMCQFTLYPSFSLLHTLLWRFVAPEALLFYSCPTSSFSDSYFPYWVDQCLATFLLGSVFTQFHLCFLMSLNLPFCLSVFGISLLWDVVRVLGSPALSVMLHQAIKIPCFFHPPASSCCLHISFFYVDVNLVKLKLWL